MAAACGDDTPSAGSADGDPTSTRPGVLIARVGDPLPPLALARHDGSELDVAGLAGTPTVLNFWAPWCVPCVVEMPAIEGVHQELGDEVRFVGVAATSMASEELEVVERTGVTYDIVRDPDGSAMFAFGVMGIPTTIFVGADGRLVRIHPGEIDESELRDGIDELLAG
jgi:thiol-disulfide isomerase/thioredoxin